jgi:outer membrane protein assembly factor BamB
MNGLTKKLEQNGKSPARFPVSPIVNVAAVVIALLPTCRLPAQDRPAPNSAVGARETSAAQIAPDGVIRDRARPEFDTRYTASPVADTPSPVDPRDWLFWRGSGYDGVSCETGLVDDFDPEGGPDGNVLWRRTDLGGRSTPIVMDGRLYVLLRAEPGTSREGERVVCVNAETGETIWENRFNVYLSDVPDTRVGWSACVGDPETGTIFALGVCGHFQCLDARTGQTRWYVPLHERFGLLSTYGGRTNFPVICEDLVIVSGVIIGWGEMAKPAHRLIAFDKRTGEVAWFNSTRELPEDTTYSSPTLAVLNEQLSLVFGSGDGSIWSFQPRTGRPIWEYMLSRRGINAPPLVAHSWVYAGHSEENLVGTTMGALVAIDTAKAPADLGANITQTAEAWRLDELAAGRSQPTLVGDQLWVFDDGAKLRVLNAATGEQIGKRVALGRMMHGSPLQADGKIYAFESNGRWAIYRPLEQGEVEVVSSGRMPQGEECQGSPSCSHGRVYLQTTGALYCLQDPEKTPGATTPQAASPEPPVSGDAKPAAVQVFPAEVLLQPGQTQQFAVRVFNARGQLLPTIENAKFSLEGPGQISESGRFTAASDAPHVAAFVGAQVGELAGRARIRVVPDLPWSFTFDNREVPVPWVGARYRHIILDDDLLQELRQANPVAAQLYIYFQSAFDNTQRPVQTYDNSTPQQKWTDLQRFLRISVTSLEQAQQQLDPALDVLITQRVLARRQWNDVANVGIRLVVAQGDRPLQGNGVMTKIATLPKGTRSRCWFGPSDLHDYTIQADVRGAIKDNQLPDIGLIAQGYTLDLQGEHQRLQIRSWDPQLRMAKTIDFGWQPDRWYTMKFRAALEDGQAVLRAKVWPREQPEPVEWMLEATDEVPNESGSPGLFGNASNAEIFLDNIRVTAN